MNRKILISDYDDTFFVDENSIEENKESVKKFRENHNIFIFNTGRSYSSFKSQIDKYKLEYDYLIINHGASVVDNKNKVHFNFCISNELIKSIIKVMDEYEYKYLFYSKLTELDKPNGEVTKIIIYTDTVESCKIVKERLLNDFGKYIDIYISKKCNLEIVSKECNKSKAIKLFIKKFNFNINNIYTIGDSYTDIKMIKDFNGACMENSIIELKNDSKIKKYKSVTDFINYIEN